MRKIVLSAALAAGLVFAGSAAAMAVENGPDPSRSTTTYTPVDPTEPTLAGTASSSCIADVPWINYDITLVDPDNKATSHAASLVMTNGTESVVIPLGTLVDNKLKGSTLWPGAKVENGVAAGWPGWAFVNGEWVETSGNYAWTKGSITSYITVNPELPVILAYPPATPACQPADVELGLTLPATGMNGLVLPIGIAAGAATILGAAVLLIQRRRSRA